MQRIYVLNAGACQRVMMQRRIEHLVCIRQQISFDQALHLQKLQDSENVTRHNFHANDLKHAGRWMHPVVRYHNLLQGFPSQIAKGLKYPTHHTIGKSILGHVPSGFKPTRTLPEGKK